MSDPTIDPQTIHNALRSIPAAKFVLTCSHDQYSDGIITYWVQQCSTVPPMVVVAIKKGQAIEPMLRDARAFALCMVNDNDRRVQRLFGSEHTLDDDPFLLIPTLSAVTGMPILKNALMWFDCTLEGHLSPDADCRLYLGQIVAAYVQDPKPTLTGGTSNVSTDVPEHRKVLPNNSGKVTAKFKK